MQAMTRTAWNRNIHYHDLVLRAVPPGCRRALDVGCGDGRLASELAETCGEVIGIDSHAPTLARARDRYRRPNLAFVDGDVMTHPFALESFDLVSAVATLHHLPLEPALLRMRDLLKRGGVLVVIGLYRTATLADVAYDVAGKLAGWGWRVTHAYEEVEAPTQDPDETLEAIRTAAERILPGVALERQLVFRYSLVWQKP